VGKHLPRLDLAKTRISFFFVLLFLSISLGWYVYTSGATSFDAVVGFGDQVSRNLIADFFNPMARTTTVLRGLGGGEAVSFGHQVGRIFFYTAEFLILIGIVQMLLKRDNAKLGREYSILAVLSFSILVIAIVVPNFARFFRMERFYQISLLFLAPFLIFGLRALCDFVRKKGKNETLTIALALVVIIPFFFFETGFIYEITGDFSYSIPLSMYRMDRILLYSSTTSAKEISGAQWLSHNQNASHSVVYGDFIATFNVLTSYGMMSGENLLELSNRTYPTQTLSSDGMIYVYLREVNTVERVLVGQSEICNSSDILSSFATQNFVYSNGLVEAIAINNIMASVSS
jgi:uncharacterized membrane protein